MIYKEITVIMTRDTSFKNDKMMNVYMKISLVGGLVVSCYAPNGVGGGFNFFPY